MVWILQKMYAGPEAGNIEQGLKQTEIFWMNYEITVRQTELIKKIRGDILC